MNSFTEDDSALPMDFSGSNTGEVGDVTYGTHLEYADGSVPMVTKTGSGRMSPVRARTMKEYDQQIAELKKENFSLKLRIYFLEEKVQQKFDGDSEDLFKTNIELKVEVESLKKELLDKQDLLKKASTALESISAQHQVELQQAKNVSQSTLEEKIHRLEKQLEIKQDEMDSAERVLEESQKQLLDLVTANKKLQNQLDQAGPGGGPGGGTEVGRHNLEQDRDAEFQEKERMIRQLQSVLKTKERIIEQQEEEGREALKDAQEQIEELRRRKSHKPDATQELDVQLERLEEDNRLHEENALKRDKAIQGLASALQKKALEVERLENLFNDKDHGGRESRGSDMVELEERAAELESMLREKQYENERLQKTISRRETEVQRLSQQLEKSDEDLRQREDALQVMLDDAQRQLSNQEKMLQHLSKSLQDKDRQLQDYMHMLQEQRPLTEKQDSIISSIRSQLRDKEEAIEAAIEDKFKALEEKDTEVRQLKTGLRERDRDIERANQMLLTTEETIDTLEREAKDRDSQVKHLTSQVKVLQRSKEEEGDEHQRGLEEKEALIQRLQNALNQKDQNLDASIRASPSATDTMIQQLQERLQEKDKLLQEVMLERSKAAESGESASRHLLAKLRDKEGELEEADQKSREKTVALQRQLQNLQAEINKKDYELQTMENRASWAEEQQQEMIDKMRSAVNEKDKTIQALVESAKEKDKLFRQLQIQSPDAYAGASASKLAELQEAKDEVVRLRNEMRKQDDLIERLRDAADRKLSRHDVVPRKHMEEAEEELGRRTEALTRALKAEKEAKRSLNEFRKRLEGGGVGETEEMMRLREENQRLRREAERPGTPQRSHTLIGGETNIQLSTMMQEQLQEAKRLSDALRMEREIYVNINQVGSAPQSDQTRAFEIELSAVQALKQQLAEGVERNNKLRAALEQQMSDLHRGDTSSNSGITNTDNIEALVAKVSSLEHQLEDSSRWNQSLQQRLSQRPPTSTTATTTMTHHRDGGVGQAAQDSRSVTSPVPASRETSLLQDSTYNVSYLPSFRQLPDLANDPHHDLMPSQEALEDMSPEQLRDVIHRVAEALRHSQASTQTFQAQLEAVSGRNHDIPGENSQDVVDTGGGTGGGEGGRKETERLKAKLKHTEHLNELLKQQIKLSTKSDSTPAGFNPELIVQMAAEIQRLKQELEDTREKHAEEEEQRRRSSDAGGSTFTVTSPLSKSSAEAQVALQKQMESLRSELYQQKDDNRQLSSKLASTEATVRSQTDKVRHYRGLLEKAGLLAPLHRRSCSESSLSNIGGAEGTSKPPSGRGRLSSASTGNLSGGKAASNDMISKLKAKGSSPGGHKTLAKLRHRIEESRDLTSELVRQQGRPSDISGSDPGASRVTSLKGKLGEAANLCTDMAVYLDGNEVDTLLHGSDLDLVDLQTRHDEALHRIQQLETQLERSGSGSGSPSAPHTPAPTPGAGAAVQQHLEQLREENAKLSQRSAVLEIEVAKLRKQLTKEQKRSAQDVEKLRNSVEERDSLNSNLRQLLNENQTVGQKLQSELQRLKTELRRLQKLEAEVKQGRKMSDSIERARHRTGDSVTSYPSISVHPEEGLDESPQHSPKWGSEHGSHKVHSDAGSIRMSPANSNQSPEGRERMRHATDGSVGSGPRIPSLGMSPPVLDSSSLLEDDPEEEEDPWSGGPQPSPQRLRNELEHLRQQLMETDAAKKREVAEVRSQLEERESELSHTSDKLDEAHKDLRRLSEEVGRLHVELEEKHSMNNTLQLELGIYDKMHNEGSSPDKMMGSQVDLTLLLEELRQLRQQLVKTIENNNVLRQKLEEQLKQNQATTQIYHHYHNSAPPPPPQHEADNQSGYNRVWSAYDYANAYIDRHERFTVSGQSNSHLSINSHMTSDSHAPPDQMDRLHETDVPPGLSAEDLASTNSQWHSSTSLQQPIGSQHSVNAEQLYLHSNQTQEGQTLQQNGGAGGGKSRGDNSMRYSIHDPMRPPKVSHDAKHAAAGDQSLLRVGSDLRSLYAIGELDDYELLKKEISESIALLSGCEARVKERLKHFQRQSPSQNIEHATLRGIHGSLDQLSFCLREQQRLIILFWTSQLPRKDENNTHTSQDPTLTREKSHLQNQLVVLASKYAKARKDLATAEKRLGEQNNMKEKTEAYIIKKLNRHSDTLVSVEKNLEQR